MRLRLLALLLPLAVLASACAEEEPTDFTLDNEAGFLAACSDPLDDAELTGMICGCVLERTLEAFPFSDFRAIDEALKSDPEQPLQAEINLIIANCVIEESDL